MCGALDRVGVPLGVGLLAVGVCGLPAVGGGEGCSVAGYVWAARWEAGGERQGRGLRLGGCCVRVCVRLQRGACVVRCRVRGVEEKLVVFCGPGKHFADERSYLVHLLVSGGKRVFWLWAKAYAGEDPVDGVVPAGEGCCGLGRGSFQVSGPALICVCWRWGRPRSRARSPWMASGA